jgi:CysZ protein
MFFKDFSNGVSSYSKALQLISKLNLWKYFFIPALIGLFIGVGVVWIAIGTSDNIGNWLAQIWTWDWGKGVFTTLSHWIGGFIVLIIGVVAFKHIVQAFSSPFMGPVSEKIEEHLTGKEIESNPFMVLLIRGLRINIRNLFREILFTIPLIILGFIPVIGLIATVWIFYIQCYYAGYGNMDYTLERYLTYKQSNAFVKKNRGIAAGNGLLFILMLFIPILGITLTLPISTVAATIETLKKLEKEGKVILLKNN